MRHHLVDDLCAIEGDDVIDYEKYLLAFPITEKLGASFKDRRHGSCCEVQEMDLSVLFCLGITIRCMYDMLAAVSLPLPSGSHLAEYNRVSWEARFPITSEWSVAERT